MSLVRKHDPSAHRIAVPLLLHHVSFHVSDTRAEAGGALLCVRLLKLLGNADTP